jgi:hypothetical protein
MPQTIPLQDSDFEQSTPHNSSIGADSQQNELSSPWLSKGANIVLDYHEAFGDQEMPEIDEKPLRGLDANNLSAPESPPVVIVLDSYSVLNQSSAQSMKPKSYKTYPFYNIRLAAGQLFFYCPQALTTGADPKVSWSAVVRDLVAYKLEQPDQSLGSSGFQGPVYGAVGEPIQSSEREWCRQNEAGTSICPGIACEIQIRTPLPILNDSITGSYLTNPDNNAQIPQIPPVPPELL